MSWTNEFFNDLYWQLFMKRSLVEIKQQTLLIKQLVEGKKLDNLLDVCCGIGDIAHQLEKDLKIPATGIEYSADYINLAQIKNMIQGDACQKQTHEKFSLVLNWYSSFAYFNPEKNQTLLTQCSDYCLDTFLLESYNPYAVIHSFEKKFNYEKKYLDSIYQVTRECELDIQNRKLNQFWIIKSQDYYQEHQTYTYLYFPDELEHILKQTGFNQIQIFGIEDLKLTSLQLKTPRFVVKAEK